MQEIYLIEYIDSNGVTWVGNYAHPSRKEAMKVALEVLQQLEEQPYPNAGSSTKIVAARPKRYVLEPEHHPLTPREIAIRN